MQKPGHDKPADDAHELRDGDTQLLIAEAIGQLSPGEAANPSHIYARVLRQAIKNHRKDANLLADQVGFELAVRSKNLWT